MSTATLTPTLELNFESADPTNYFIEAINNLAKAQMACNRKLEHHITKNNEFQRVVNSELKVINKKLTNQQNQITRNSVHIAYIKNIIKEAAKHYGIPQKNVTYENILTYRKSFVKAYDIRWRNLFNRLQRIRFMCDAEGIKAEFEREVCTRIGLTRDQVCMEPQAVAMHFNDGYSKMSFNDSLELNKKYMDIAKEVIFALEKRYGIYDTDKKQGIELHCKMCFLYNDIHKLSDKDYIEWVENIIEKYKEFLLKDTDANMVTNMVFGYFERRYNKWHGYNTRSENRYSFCGNFSIDMHKILSDERLRVKFPDYIIDPLIGMWNGAYAVATDYLHGHNLSAYL